VDKNKYNPQKDLLILFFMDKSLMLRDIQSHLKFTKGTEFAKYLGIKPTVLSNWHSRSTFDNELLYTKCDFLNPHWLLTGKGEMLLTNSNQQQPTAMPTGDLEKDLIAKFSNISTRDISFYTYLNINTMMKEPIFKSLMENLATTRALELLKEK